MPLKPYEEVVEPLRFPIGEKTYAGYGPTLGGWALIRRVEAGTATPEEIEGVDLYRLALGPLHDELVADNVPFEAYKQAALACAAWARTGDMKFAAAVWEHGNDRAAVTAALAEPEEAPAEPVKAPAKPRGRKTAAR